MSSSATVTETPTGKRLYWSTMPFMNYVFKKGKMAVFRHLRFATDNPAEIQELDEEIAAGHPQLYIKQDARFVTEEMEDPMKALRAKFFAEFQAQQASFVNPANDMGSYKNDGIKPQSTTDIAATAAGGNGAQTAAALLTAVNNMAQAAPAVTAKK